MTEKPFEKANLQEGGDAESTARKVLLSGQKNRIRAAEKGLEAICAEYRVILDLFMIVRATETAARAQFVPQEGWAGDPSSTP